MFNLHLSGLERSTTIQTRANKLFEVSSGEVSILKTLLIGFNNILRALLPNFRGR